jgi:uncharacterized protein (DUF362 family)
MDTVVVRTTQKDDDSDRFALLEQVIEEAGFWDILEKQYAKSGKTKKDYLIAVKPNIMMFYSKDDMSVITEPALVEHLIDKIAEKGYSNIAVVESQNVFGNWFDKRDVENVADVAGYEPKKHNPPKYRIVDLTMDVVAHIYKGSLGTYLAGKTWKEADFRISFAKNKTHFSCYYTLTIKNIYGTTPEQNKFREYHLDREVDEVTVDMVEEFPVHFGIVDGIWSADGLLGIKSDYTPKNTKTIIAGASLLAVDIVGGQKMGLNPMRNRFVKLAAERFGKPDINVIGDTSKYKDWDNVMWGMDYMLDYGEELGSIANVLGYLSSQMDPDFPMKDKKPSWLTNVMRGIFAWFIRTVSRLE